jgi:integrase
MYYHDPTRTPTRKAKNATIAARARRATRNDANERGENGKGGAAHYACHGACRPILDAHGKTKEGEKEMKKSMRGMGRIFLRGGVWWIAYYHRGVERRESANSEKESDATKLLKRRLSEIQTGRVIVDEEKVTFKNLVDGLVTDYKLNERRSLKSAALNNVKHLRAFFGFDRAVDITSERLTKYQLHRREQGASVATVNRECATLRRMFSLAIKAGKLSRRPVFEMLAGERIRQGFVEHGDFLRLLGEMAEHIQPLVEFLYYGGWRKSAARNLEWKEIDMHGRTARLKAEDSKNAEPWVLPLAGRLWEVIQQRAKARRLDCPFVFHLDGKKIGDFRKVWKTACDAAGLEGLLIHDLRRCAARNLSRAGVQEQTAMKITGHKTPSMYRRYRIVDEKELREAQEKLQAHLSATQSEKIAVIGA